MLMVHNTRASFNVLCRMLCSPLYVLVSTDTNNERTRWWGGESERERDTERERDRERERHRQTDRQTQTVTHTETQRERQTDR